jgi:hypothetical protein
MCPTARRQVVFYLEPELEEFYDTLPLGERSRTLNTLLWKEMFERKRRGAGA